MKQDILNIQHLCWQVPGGGEVIRDLDLSLQDGKLVVVTGPNGGGKSTLAKLIAGVATPASGRVLVKAGMEREGRCRQLYLSNVGYEDCDLYAVLRKDWEL